MVPDVGNVDPPAYLSVRSQIGSEPVFVIATGEIVGTSQTVRNDGGVNYVLKTSQLTPGDAVTMWFGVYNNPDACAASPCDFPDALNPATEADFLYAAGHVIGGSGQATFAGHRSVGDTEGSIFSGVGLLNPMGAEIQLIVRSHGPAIPGMTDEQISTFNGGCNPGEPNEGLCEDVQFSVHQP
jgi:hypothetical protein